MKRFGNGTGLLALAVAAAGLLAAPQIEAQMTAGRQAEPEEEAKKLGVGDKAPKIDLAHWVKGDKVTSFDSDHIYVIEFWATWCPPCRTSMPHLSELQKEYKDKNVRIIGISDEPEETVRNFLDSGDWPEKTKYTLAADPDRSAFNDYMKAAGQNGIPTAFIVGKDQRVQWIGHPMNMDEPLEKIVAGEWSVEEQQRLFERQQREEQAMESMFEMLQEGNSEEALKQIDALIAEGSSELMFIKFDLLLTQMDKPEEAYQTARLFLENNWDDSDALNQISWYIATNPQIKERNLKIARMAALRAAELTNYEDANILDTVGRVHHEMGENAKAARYQRMAVEHADNDEMRREFQQWLDRYVEAAGDDKDENEKDDR